jgi:carbon monoxide dehydrogenase subunit G
MASHSNSIVVDAPRAKVFEYVNDPRTLSDWMIGIEEIRNVRGAGEGQQYDWTFKMAGLSLRGQSVVVDYLQDVGACHQGIGMIHSLWTHRCEDTAEGTKLTIDVEYTLPFFVLGRLAESATVRRNDRNINTSLKRLKEIVERMAGR